MCDGGWVREFMMAAATEAAAGEIVEAAAKAVRRRRWGESAWNARRCASKSGAFEPTSRRPSTSQRTRNLSSACCFLRAPRALVATKTSAEPWVMSRNEPVVAFALDVGASFGGEAVI